MHAWETSGFLHPSTAQTNNRAELQAVISVLHHLKSIDINLVVAMDSQYVYDGLRGAAFRWRSAGWVGQLGPVCNIDLWIILLELVDSVVPTVRWLRVPSHTNIPGNERVDRLAEEGQISSPMYHVSSLPERPVINLELPSTPTPRRAPAVPRSLEMNDIITPSHDTPALHRSIDQRLSQNDLDTLPPICLDFSDCISL